MPTDDETLECPSCGHRPSAWGPGPGGRPNASCPGCGALERHRFLALLLDAMRPVVETSGRVLEYAPQPQIRSKLSSMVGEGRYVGIDLLDGRFIDCFADAGRLPLRTAAFDLVVCFHVFEHVPDDAAAMAELARVLSPGGVALVQVPRRAGRPTDEDPSAPIEERITRFGQHDHVRYYGSDFEDRLARAGMRVGYYEAGQLFDEATRRRHGVLPQDPLWVCRSDLPSPPDTPARKTRRFAYGFVQKMRTRCHPRAASERLRRLRPRARKAHR